MSKYKIGSFVGNELMLLLESEGGKPFEFDSFEEAFAHQSKYPSHHNDGSPIHWVILPPKSEAELTKK